MVFSDFWAGQAVKTTLVPKFGSPIQKWARAGLGGGGAATKSRALASLLVTRGRLPGREGCPKGGALPSLHIGGPAHRPPQYGGRARRRPSGNPPIWEEGRALVHNCPPSRGAWGGGL
jgi:hypothetical protein